MSKITLYLDKSSLTFVDQASKAHGMSKSRWVAEVIRNHAMQEWPQDCLALAGRFPDFPLRSEGMGTAVATLRSSHRPNRLEANGKLALS